MKHIVFFKLNERNEQNQDALIEILNKMKGQIPFVQDMWVGKDFLNSQRSFDVVLEVTLNKEDLDTYANYPLHVACKNEFAPLVSKSVVCDVYETIYSFSRNCQKNRSMCH